MARRPPPTTRRRSCSSPTSTPQLNANPDTFDMTTFAPTYSLINGRPYDGTANGTLPIVSAPGHDVLLRMVNAAVHFHPIGLLGLRESVVGESSHALRYPRSAIATTSPRAARPMRSCTFLRRVRGRSLRALRHRPAPLQRHPGRLRRDAHDDRRHRDLDDHVRRARDIARPGARTPRPARPTSPSARTSLPAPQRLQARSRMPSTSSTPSAPTDRARPSRSARTRSAAASPRPRS